MDGAGETTAAPTPKGARGRVAESHRQARRGLAVTAAFLLAVPIAALVPHRTGAWLPLHLFLVGGLLSAISAVTQMLSITWSSSPPPARGPVAAQRWSLATGTVLLLVGRERDVTWLCAVGGALVVVSLVILAVILVGIRQSAVTDRYGPAIDAYLGGVAFGIVGSAIGAAIAVDGVAADHLASLRSAHLIANVFGLVGLVIAGTLPFFIATQARMKMSPLATAPRIRATVALLAATVATTVIGYLVDMRMVAAVGLAAYAVGLAGILALLPRVGARQLDYAGPRLLQLGAGVAWWTLATILLAYDASTGGDPRPEVLRALVVGGFAQILVGSLAYLGPVVRGGGHRMLTAGFATTRSWPSLVVGNVAGVLALAGQDRALASALVVWLVDVVVRGARLVTTSTTPRPAANPVGGAGQDRNGRTPADPR